MGSYWFRRLKKDCKRISKHIKFVRIAHNFYRVYWNQAHVHEVYGYMPQFGHDIYEKDSRFMSKKFYEEYEDRAQFNQKIKNFVEGYWDSLDTIQTRVYLMRHSKEHYDTAVKAYAQMVVK